MNYQLKVILNHLKYKYIQMEKDKFQEFLTTLTLI